MANLKSAWATRGTVSFFKVGKKDSSGKITYSLSSTNFRKLSSDLYTHTVTYSCPHIFTLYTNNKIVDPKICTCVKLLYRLPNCYQNYHILETGRMVQQLRTLLLYRTWVQSLAHIHGGSQVLKDPMPFPGLWEYFVHLVTDIHAGRTLIKWKYKS